MARSRANGRHDAARQRTRASRPAPPDVLHHTLATAWQHLQAGQLPEALEICRRVLAASPKLLRALGCSLWQLGRAGRSARRRADNRQEWNHAPRLAILDAPNASTGSRNDEQFI
jgi:hypothetical protein